VGELVELRWEQVDLQRVTLHVNRKKAGYAATHPISGREQRALTVSWHSRLPKDGRDVSVKLRRSGGKDATVVVDGPADRIRSE
jgi:integrase